MSRDSQVTHIHLKKSHHVLYIANWVHDKLPFDTIDNPKIQNVDNEQDISLSLPPTTFGSIRSHKRKQESVWKDLDIYKLIDDQDGYVKETGYGDLLKKLEKIHNSKIDTFDQTLHDKHLDLDSSFSSNSSFSNTSSSSLPNIDIAATPDTRNRSAQRTMQTFHTPATYQTPISRIR